MSFRIGSLVYATWQGLGILAKSFFDAGVVTDVMVIWHGRHHTHDEWYLGAPQVGDLRSPAQRRQMVEFCKSMDRMLYFETPFDWTLLDECRRAGVKTFLMPMFECMPAKLPSQPDHFINPSLLDQQYYPHGMFVPIPVEGIPWRQRTKAEVFVHNAGHGGLKGRNGTAEVVDAFNDHVKSEAKLLLRAQDSSTCSRKFLNPDKISCQFGTIHYENLWTEGDVFLFPEKFNGLSLPLQEARAAGMLVMCGDRFPMNTWLPRECLIPVKEYRQNKIGPPYNTFEEAQFDPRMIAAVVDEWYGRDIEEYSRQGKEWAESMSWATLKPRYLEVLAS